MVGILHKVALEECNIRILIVDAFLRSSALISTRQSITDQVRIPLPSAKASRRPRGRRSPPPIGNTPRTKARRWRRWPRTGTCRWEGQGHVQEQGERGFIWRRGWRRWIEWQWRDYFPNWLLFLLGHKDQKDDVASPPEPLKISKWGNQPIVPLTDVFGAATQKGDDEKEEHEDTGSSGYVMSEPHEFEVEYNSMLHNHPVPSQTQTAMQEDTVLNTENIIFGGMAQAQ